MSDDCVLCRVYRPDAEPRLPHRWPVDEGCRHRFDRHVADIDDLTAALLDLSTMEPTAVRGGDPIAALGGAGPIRARSGQPVVSGSREPALPIDEDLVDLLAPARAGTVRDTLVPKTTTERVLVRSRKVVVDADGAHIREVEYTVLTARPVLDPDGNPLLVAAGDQIGYLSAATVLDEIVRDWRDTLWPDHSLPPVTVYQLTRWMRDRADEACDRHPGIAANAQEIRELRTALRRALGETEPLPKPILGSLCKTDGCDQVSQLMRHDGSEYIECDACGRLYTEDEYRDWTARLAHAVRSKNTHPATA
ncbi:hypothetical protein [Micromonospora sp. RV43]|uniref:hypothetical protein n=1 Tax=Micromonospora sp. RV43 TaxID=1661387 RepID=UPI00064C010F|nr:hypothetical protein [Micromonospora sp. RV43]